MSNFLRLKHNYQGMIFDPSTGEWTVWQGVDGVWTHQGLWKHAFDWRGRYDLSRIDRT